MQVVPIRALLSADWNTLKTMVNKETMQGLTVERSASEDDNLASLREFKKGQLHTLACAGRRQSEAIDA